MCTVGVEPNEHEENRSALAYRIIVGSLCIAHLSALFSLPSALCKSDIHVNLASTKTIQTNQTMFDIDWDLLLFSDNVRGQRK